MIPRVFELLPSRELPPLGVLPVGEAVMKDHAARVRFLAERAARDALDPRVMQLARQLASDCPKASRRELAAHLLDVVQRRVLFVIDPDEPELGDLYRTPMETWEEREGDCDDSSPLLASLAAACGLRSAIVAMGRGDYPRHVSCVIHDGDEWQWAEPTLLGARYGEHPVTAKKRLDEEQRTDI